MDRVFQFNLLKAAQAVAVILQEERLHRMNYMKLLKLIAICEREFIRESGKMIVGDLMVAMERGPLPSRIYSLIRGEDPCSPDWSQFFERDRYELSMLKNPGIGSLSRREVEKLQEVTRRHASDDEWTMVTLTHEFPEWQKNKPKKGSCEEIPQRDIIEAVGADAAAIIERAQKDAMFDDFFPGNPPCAKATRSPFVA